MCSVPLASVSRGQSGKDKDAQRLATTAAAGVSTARSVTAQMGDRIPDPGSELEEEGVPDHEGPLPEKVDTGDPQEGMAAPADNPDHADDYGVTLDEQRTGTPIGERLQEEQPEELPDFDPEAGTADPYPSDTEERRGRIVTPDEGAAVDTEKDNVGYDAGTDRGGFSNEERGMHIHPESPDSED